MDGGPPPLGVVDKEAPLSMTLFIDPEGNHPLVT